MTPFDPNEENEEKKMIVRKPRAIGPTTTIQDKLAYIPGELPSQEEMDEAYDRAYAMLKEEVAKEQPKEEIKRDYNFRKKVILKGKMAPPGFVYLVIDMKVKDTKYVASRMINGRLANLYQEAILSELRESLREKYGI